MSADAFRPDLRPVRLAVQVAPQHAPLAELRDLVLRLEDLGVDLVFNWDHFFPLSGDPDGLHFEAWTQLAQWAEATERIELGPLVNCNSYRNPDLQADMARTVDHVSGGRLVFGTGSGWQRRDYDAYGYPFGTAGSRLDDLARDLPRIRERWTRLNPPPVRRIPILIGGGGERKTLRIAAQHADVWHSFADADALPHKLAVLERHAADVGRDPAEIEIASGLRTAEPAEARALFDAGVRMLQVGVSGPGFDGDLVRRAIARRDELNG